MIGPCRKVASQSPRNSSRRLLGASPAALSHKWEPRSAGAAAAAPAASPSDDGTDIEAPLLPSGSRAGSRRAADAGQAGSQSVGSRSVHRAASAGATAAPGGSGGGLTRGDSVDRLTKYGGSDFTDESLFFPASRSRGRESEVRCMGLPWLSSSPLWLWHPMHSQRPQSADAKPSPLWRAELKFGHCQVSAADAHDRGIGQL